MTLARGFTATFAGIALNHVHGFVVAQFVSGEGERTKVPSARYHKRAAERWLFDN